MTIEQLFVTLRARWIIAVSAFLLVVTVVTGVTLWLPKTYTAAASVVLDIKSPDPIAGAVLAGVASPTYLLTQIDIITSRRVAERVVKKLNLTASPTLREQWMKATNGAGNFESWVADAIRAGLDARPSRGSNVIRVFYESPDPNFSAALANSFVSAYLETTMDLRTDPAKQYSEFFDDNGRKLRERLEVAQSKLSEYLQKENIVVSDERMDVELTRLNDLSAQHVAAQSAAADSSSRKTFAASQREKSQDVMLSPLVSTIKTDLVKQESMLQQLKSRLGDQHPQVVELQTGVNDLRAKLDAEIKRTMAGIGVADSVNASRASQLGASVQEQRAKVLKMKAARDEAALLQRDVDSARQAYESVMARLNMTSLESKGVQSNVAALEQASLPTRPTSPRVFVNIALGIVLGAVIALLSALVLERFDRRLRTSSDVEGLIQLPVLGTMPVFKKNAVTDKSSARFRLTGSSATPSLAN